VQTDSVSKTDAGSLLSELGNLAATLGIEVADKILLRTREKTASHLLGKGKVQEIINAAKAEDADSIIFDHPLTPYNRETGRKIPAWWSTTATS
jgi:GTP-binding protein HflX